MIRGVNELVRIFRTLKWGSTLTWLLVVAISVAFWILESQHSFQRAVLVIGLSLSSFSIGSIVGFLFTSYGEESATVGKVRDWLIGGLTGLTIAKAGSIKALLLTFSYGPGPQEFAITVGTAITFAGLGFFFMFFQRELVLNVYLAESRAHRGQIEGTDQAGLVTQKLLATLPPSLLSGIDDIDDLVTEQRPEAENLRKLLYSDEVSNFMNEAEKAAKSGSKLDWDVVSKMALLQYYRTYYEKGEDKDAQQERAEEWLVRALLMNPNHADLTAKHADVLGMMKRYSETVEILERLRRSPEAPAYIEQWLGYFLLFVPNRELEAIRYSEDYHRRFPDEGDSLFNSACGYAQIYCQEMKDGGSSKNSDSESRRLALERLKEALSVEPDYAQIVKTDWIQPGESFECFSKDPEFRSLVGMEAEGEHPLGRQAPNSSDTAKKT